MRLPTDWDHIIEPILFQTQGKRKPTLYVSEQYIEKKTKKKTPFFLMNYKCHFIIYDTAKMKEKVPLSLTTAQITEIYFTHIIILSLPMKGPGWSLPET